MKKYVLFGKGISHSLSPIIQAAIGKYYDLEMNYEIKDCESVEEILSYLRSGEYDGANVTMPYKVALIEHMDRLDASAEDCAAINTVKIEDGKLVGYNTDAQGFLDVFHINDYEIENKRVLVYGTGGVARAIINALLDAGAKTVLLEGRNQDAKHELYGVFEHKSDDRMTVMYGLHGLICDLVVNASSLGSEAQPGLSIDLDKLDAEAVFDVVYLPQETELIKLAKQRGLHNFKGIEMLICQAIRAFYIWNPESFRRDINLKLFNAIMEDLNRSSERETEG